jgi:hypothetical protein
LPKKIPCRFRQAKRSEAFCNAQLIDGVGVIVSGRKR